MRNVDLSHKRRPIPLDTEFCRIPGCSKGVGLASNAPSGSVRNERGPCSTISPPTALRGGAELLSKTHHYWAPPLHHKVLSFMGFDFFSQRIYVRQTCGLIRKIDGRGGTYSTLSRGHTLTASPVRSSTLVRPRRYDAHRIGLYFR